MSKHIQVLEQAGLVTRSRDAQRRPVHLDAAALERLTGWIDRYRLDAERSYRRLDGLLAAIKHTEDTKEGTVMMNALDSTPRSTPWRWTTRATSTHPLRACSAPTPNPNWSSGGSGPRGNEMQIDHWDFRTGGGYRYRTLGPDGGSTGSTGYSTPCVPTN